MTEKFCYSKEEAARSLGISPCTIEEIIARGELKTKCIGEEVVISNEALRRFADGQIARKVRRTPRVKKVTYRGPNPVCPLDARLIPLSRGRFAIVDESDYELLSRWKWQAVGSSSRGKGGYYAGRRSCGSAILMHREILGISHDKHLVGDHINRDRLDNRRSNLRAATHAENARNHGKQRNNTSGFKGVSCLAVARYRASIWVSGRNVYLGQFSTPEEAHAKYCEAAAKHHGEFACFE